MISEEQSILLASDTAQHDFPAYQPGPLLSAEYEDDCWYIRLRLYQYRERCALDVLYGVYAFQRAFTATLFDACPHQIMSDDELAMQSATDHLARDFSAISILDVSISGRDTDLWHILVSFYRKLDWSMAVADYTVSRDAEGFHARRIEIDEISKGYVRRPSGTMHAHHRCTRAKLTKHP